MKRVLLYIWQLPQNLLGLLIVKLTKAKKLKAYYKITKTFGVSLGKYIILGGDHIDTKTVKHEQGHQKQSLYLGLLYLLIIGLPSASGNLWDMIFHKNWRFEDRYAWYYNLPWEKWADKLGKVKR